MRFALGRPFTKTLILLIFKQRKKKKKSFMRGRSEGSWPASLNSQKVNPIWPLEGQKGGKISGEWQCVE